MPCLDGREQHDHDVMQLRLDALTALLSGLMKQDERLIQFAYLWGVHHHRTDQLREQGDEYGEEMAMRRKKIDRLFYLILSDGEPGPT